MPIVSVVNVLETRFESLCGKYTTVTYLTREILTAYSREVQVDDRYSPETIKFEYDILEWLQGAYFII